MQAEKLIIVTGGAGFIGSHTVLELLKDGYNVLAIDNLSNSYMQTILNIKILHDSFSNRSVFHFIKGDIMNIAALEISILRFLKEHRFQRVDAAIHFAGLKSVPESFEKPELYWDTNVVGTLRVIQLVQRFFCPFFIFSSSCTVYGNQIGSLIDENTPLKPINPYGYTKYAVESLLATYSNTHSTFNYTSLRYFNPLGAHPSRLLGDRPKSAFRNLIPILYDSYKKKKTIKIYGDKFPTTDGTCVRDYLHVMDLAKAHVMALNHNFSTNQALDLNVNLGTGRGYTVLEVVRMFESLVGDKLNLEIVEARTGEAYAAVANPHKAKEILGWQAELSLLQMIKDHLEFMKETSLEN